jgi:hypothetical protein
LRSGGIGCAAAVATNISANATIRIDIRAS